MENLVNIWARKNKHRYVLKWFKRKTFQGKRLGHLSGNWRADNDDRTDDFCSSLLSYNVMEEGLVKILLDQDDPANKFCPIICIFTRSYDRWSALEMILKDKKKHTKKFKNAQKPQKHQKTQMHPKNTKTPKKHKDIQKT